MHTKRCFLKHTQTRNVFHNERGIMTQISKTSSAQLESAAEKSDQTMVKNSMFKEDQYLKSNNRKKEEMKTLGAIENRNSNEGLTAQTLVP